MTSDELIDRWRTERIHVRPGHRLIYLLAFGGAILFGAAAAAVWEKHEEIRYLESRQEPPLWRVQTVADSLVIAHCAEVGEHEARAQRMLQASFVGTGAHPFSHPLLTPERLQAMHDEMAECLEALREMVERAKGDST